MLVKMKTQNAKLNDDVRIKDHTPSVEYRSRHNHIIIDYVADKF